MSDKSSNRKYLIWLWTLFSIPFIAIIVIFILISRDKLGTVPSFEELENPEYSLAAEVYSSDGVLLGKISIENRTWTDFDEISPDFIDALIATEDIRFYKHSGIDVRGLARVAVRTILLGSNTGGGRPYPNSWQNSCIRATRQRYRHLSEMSDWHFKFKEWHTAVKLEKVIQRRDNSHVSQ